ncbi:hypothetical protein ANN_25990 [Periplaneta americana]|uniref:THAP-type domain-containing protein n=1 Tax=Periplaneta americana TaxID=6978 RepID=A0ABQ8S4N5_PERAM|nr:hypothetical protein ANN_25990 [Periplaneta americana]
MTRRDSKDRCNEHGERERQLVLFISRCYLTATKLNHTSRTFEPRSFCFYRLLFSLLLFLDDSVREVSFPPSPRQRITCSFASLCFVPHRKYPCTRCASNLPRRAARLSLSPPSVGRAIDSRLSQYINDGWVFQVSDSRYSHSGSAVQMTYFYVSFSYLILRTVAMALYAASVHDESRVARNVLYSVPAHNYQIEIHRFLVQVATDNISLTGLNFFPVTRTVLLTDDSVCKQWIHACRRKDKINIKNATVCSVHFLPEDYERDLKAELLNIKPKKMLKISAVPSLHLNIDSRPNKMNIEASSSHQPESPQITVSDRQTRQINRHSRKRGLERLKTLSPKKKKFDVGTITDSTSDSERHLKARLDKLEKDNKQMQTEMNKLKLKNKSLTLALSRKSKHIQQLENRINAKVKERVSIVLRKIFTENQIKNLLVTKRSQNGQEKI